MSRGSRAHVYQARLRRRWREPHGPESEVCGRSHGSGRRGGRMVRTWAAVVLFHCRPRNTRSTSGDALGSGVAWPHWSAGHQNGRRKHIQTWPPDIFSASVLCSNLMESNGLRLRHGSPFAAVASHIALPPEHLLVSGRGLGAGPCAKVQSGHEDMGHARTLTVAAVPSTQIHGLFRVLNRTPTRAVRRHCRPVAIRYLAPRGVATSCGWDLAPVQAVAKTNHTYACEARGWNQGSAVRVGVKYCPARSKTVERSSKTERSPSP